MIRAFWIVLQIAVLVAIAVFLAELPGRAHLDLGTFRVDTTIGVLAGAVLLLLATTILVYRILRALFIAPRRFGEWRGMRRRGKGYEALTLGMVAVASGDATGARKQAKRAASLLGEPPLALMLAAQSAQLDGDEKTARRLYEAMLDRPETVFLGLRGLVAQAMRADDRATALLYAERANTLRPGTPWVLDALFALNIQEGNWSAADAALEYRRKSGGIDAATAKHRRAVLALERSRDAAADGADAVALDAAKTAHALDPSLVPASVQHARMLAAAGRLAQAEAALEAAWARAPHPDIADAYAEIEPGTDDLARFRRVQKLARVAGDDPAAHHALAAHAVEARLWGEARRHLDALGSDPSADACRLWAEVESGEHGDMTAANRWLARAGEAPVDPGWHCAACGAPAESWAALCRHCGAFDRLEWRQGTGQRFRGATAHISGPVPVTVEAPTIPVESIEPIRGETPRGRAASP